MPATAAGQSEGWTGSTHPVINEMLLHDVYELPREVLRGALRATIPAPAPDEASTERISHPVHPGGSPCRTPSIPALTMSS